MAHAALGSLLRYLRRFHDRSAEASDGELLRQHLSGNESAFDALLRRHAPMVWGVCRRLLDDEQDAGDAFQAVFLVLLRKAESVRVPQSLAAFLHGVASRIARKAQVTAQRRRRHEARAETPRPSDPFAAIEQRELRALLDEELDRLPEKYRAPLVLCYWEGLSYTEAARQLGWRDGTVCSRLARPRELLRQRLSRRGPTLSSAALAAALTESASAPAATVAAVSRMAALFTLGQAAGSGAVSTSVATLAQGALHAMTVAKLKTMAALAAVFCVLAGGGGLAAHRLWTAKELPLDRIEAPPPAKNAEQPGKEPLAHTDRCGDPLPEKAIARLGTVRLRHSGIIDAVTFSPDGKLVASTGQHGEVRLWDAATGKIVGALVDPLGSRTQCAAFSPDGKLLASDKGGAAIWDVAIGKKLNNLEARHTGRVTSMHFSPDGRSLVLCTDADKTIWFHDPATGKAVRQLDGHKQAVLVAVFSKDGKRLASGCKDGTACLWDVATGKVLHEFKHPTAVWDVAVSPDGKLLACKTNKGFHLWDIAARKQLHFFEMDSANLRTLAFSPDGKTIAAEGTLWDVASGKKRCTCKNNSGYGTAFSPDGKIVALGGYNGAVSLHDPATGEELPQSRGGPNRGPLTAIRFTADGKGLVTLGNDGALFWDVATQQIRRRLKTKAFPRSALAVSTTGRPTLALVEQDGALSLWDVVEGRELRRVPGEKGSANRGLTPDVVFAPDGKTFASAGYGNTIRLWETASGKELRRFQGHRGGVYALAFSRDGKALISASLDKILRFWDCASGKERRQRELEEWLRGISADGRLYAVSLDSPGGATKGLRICDTENGKEVCRLDGVSDNWCVFSPDGRSIAVDANTTFEPEAQQTILLVERASGRVRARFTGHLGILAGAAFSWDGRTLASVSWDTTCLIWDITGRLQHGQWKEATFSTAELASLWADLASMDAEKAFRAVWAMIAAGKQIVPLLRQRLRPAASADDKQKKQVARWIAELDSDEFKVREQARSSLEKLGELAEPALRQATSKPASLEARNQLRQLLDKLESISLSPTRLQEVRAVEVLEHIGTPAARRLLESLAEGAPRARLTKEAKAALQRLTSRKIPDR